MSLQELLFLTKKNWLFWIRNVGHWLEKSEAACGAAMPVVPAE